MSDQLVAEVGSYAVHNNHRIQTSMPSVGFKPAITVIEWCDQWDRLYPHCIPSK